MSNGSTNGPFRFGVYELDLAARQLRKNGARIKLQEQPFRVLQMLVERPGEVVTRDELKEKLWSEDTFVEFDHSLNTAIQKIRRALGDSADNPRFVETIPRTGYRFLVPVESNGAQPQLDPKPASRNTRLWPAAVLLSALAAFLAGWLLRPQPVIAPLSTLAGRAMPLTTYPGREFFPTFSPEGDRVAFAWEGENRDSWDIYVKLIGEDSAQRLTTHPAVDTQPAWSPDGRRIAFLRYDTTSGTSAIILVPSIGGPEREVLNRPTRMFRHQEGGRFPRTLSWHPDSRHLIATFRENRNSPWELHVVDATSGSTRRLMAASQTRVGDTDPAVSPDGHHLAFRRETDFGASRVYVVGLTETIETTGEPRIVSGELAAFSPAWSADGQQIVFAAGLSEPMQLWRVPLKGGEPRVISHPPQGTLPAVARSGDKAAFAFTSQDFDIWQARLPDMTGAKSLISSTFVDVTPQYSPDGNKIAFSSSRSGYREIWVCDQDGSNPIQLTRLESRQSAMPSWSPDGSRIAFHSYVGNQRDVFVIPSRGGRPERLTDHPGNDHQPTWSRDGQWIYFSSVRSGTRNIWKAPSGGGDAVQVTTKGDHGYAFESADGRTLYLVNHGLWSMPVEDGQPEPIADVQALSFSVSMGNNGIYLVTPRETQLDFLDLQSKTVRSVFEFPRFAVAGPGVSASPDGRTILFTQGGSPESDIMLVDDFR